jgi:DNA-3-methyladenine glycosylase
LKLNREFYEREDVLTIAKELLGKCLFTNIDQKITAGIIVETEAYMAPYDKASHAYNNKRTSRTEIFYGRGGISYVYLCYGIHHLFNIVTNRSDIPHAILIRAIEPVEGVSIMAKRRKKDQSDYSLTAGPGSLAMAMGISTIHNGVDLLENKIWLEDVNIRYAGCQIQKGPRVGVDYAEEWADKPYRFKIKDNPWTSKPK